MFLFPTLGENYGHVIFEALSTGCIPLISDTTPWNYIQTENAGFVCSLFEVDDFVNCINHVCGLSIDEKTHIGNNAVSIAKKKIEFAKNETGYRTLFK